MDEGLENSSRFAPQTPPRHTPPTQLEPSDQDDPVHDLPRNLQQSGAGIFAGKAPRSAETYFGAFEDDPEDESDASAAEPDLSIYFASFGLSTHSQIALCRTYANHLAARARSLSQAQKRQRTLEPE